ncbi:MAG: Fic family protein [Candidatus Schekmanbacteria bacterium]|nr:Fic family protein [Candidatus Schekmanbacteria bacterium]
MRSLNPAYLHRLTYSSRQLRSIQRLGQARGRQELFVAQAPEQLEVLRQAAIVASTESSNRIEGITAASKRVAAIVLENATPQNRSEQEIAGYRDALALIHESHAHIPFSPNVILQLHRMLLRYLPSDGGRWKPTDNEIVDRAADGEVLRVRFRAVPAVATPSAVAELADNYQRAREQDLDPLIIVPFAILDFLCIHPFHDGNGRMARLLTLLLLYQAGYQVGRYISLERIVEESKETYYEALERSSAGWHESGHDVTPWLEYFWGMLLRAYDEFEQRVETLLSGRGAKTLAIRRAVERRMAPFSIADIETDCPGVSRDMVRHVLRKMRLDGAIAPLSMGRSAKWVRLEGSADEALGVADRAPDGASPRLPGAPDHDELDGETDSTTNRGGR